MATHHTFRTLPHIRNVYTRDDDQAGQTAPLWGHLTAGALGIPGMKRYTEELLLHNPEYWCPRQFENWVCGMVVPCVFGQVPPPPSPCPTTTPGCNEAPGTGVRANC